MGIRGYIGLPRPESRGRMILIKQWQSNFYKLLNDEGDRGFVLRDLENSKRCHDYGCCRNIKVEEVKRDIHRIHKGRVTGPNKILVDFWNSTGGAGLESLTRLFNNILG